MPPKPRDSPQNYARVEKRKPPDFLRMIQSRTARVAVGPSAVRGRGNKGTIEAARAFLRKVDLTAFATSDASTFATVLDRHTDALLLLLPRSARHWGLARKIINLFLMDALYTKYLNEAFGLQRAEGFFELPLDSYTGGKLAELAAGELPRWPGVKHLTPNVSAQFQAAALRYVQCGFSRVHLDALWWSVERDEAGR